MLLELHIKNFALIQEVKVSFNDGFNVLCGETGSGKSILIDAINFVLGGKFSKNLIRSGENKTFVQAIFLIEEEYIKDKLNDIGIEYEDYLIISRETFKYGKTITRINNTAVNISALKELTKNILDIHGQHDNIGLLDSKKHIMYLDHYGDTAFIEKKKQFEDKFKEYTKLKNKVNKYREEIQGANQRIEFLKFQIDDIEKHELKSGEDVTLYESFNTLSNSEKIKTTLENAYNTLNGSNYGGRSIYDDLNSIVSELIELEECFPKIKGVKNDLNDAFYVIEECIREINSLSGEIYFDNNELDWINERLYIIDSMKKKYGETIDDIIQYKNSIVKEYDELQNRDNEIDELEEKILIFEKELLVLAEDLHNDRVAIGKKLSEKVNNELKFVGLEKSNFGVDVRKLSNFNSVGNDEVEFLISTNPGEPMNSLGAIVSGGELSRIMLGLKSVFIDRDKVFSVVFDEIDTGISGKIAQRVGEKMYDISKKHQVFCVTHLPQIACISDHIYRVEKKVQENKTFTNIKILDSTEKIDEIAKMSGGDNITEAIRNHAIEIIRLADNKKHRIN
ncbi:DNA repair protein RecN [Oceanirhabdus sp. W0125-5]|uniref:DNA repair protein RecN n=1 Tax=Oceanirhabdus sp. W0125-5 TaxID=2999116 RepID=UPI0022F30131|nr:DNA repair protein RecN [Oceanirhabdus sp. W0125-5]WBW95317.1 DNA repair protein RecN [Oceanirhabdus sp. W0125-5]